MAYTFINGTVYPFSTESPSLNNDSDCDYQLPQGHSDVGHIVNRVLLIATLVVGLAGNGAVLLLIASIQELRSATNTYLAVLCGANVVILSTFLPVLLAEVNISTFSAAFANWFSFELRFHCSVSILALIVLSFGRWRAVVKPMSIQTQTSTVYVAKLVAFFLAAAIITLPYAFAHKTFDGGESGVKNKLRVDNFFYFTVYYGAILLYLVPLAVIATLYISMAMKLLSKDGKIRESMRRYKKTRARRSRVAWVVLGLVLSFAICWLPYNLFYIFWVTRLYCTFPRLTNFLYLWNVPIFLLNTCIDPFSIFVLGSRFRIHLIRALHLRRLCGYTAEQHMYRGTLNGNTQCSFSQERKKSSRNDAMRLKPLIHNEDSVRGKRTY